MERTKRSELKSRGALNRTDAADYLSISTRLLDQLAAKGELTRIYVGSKPLYPVDRLDEYLKSKIEQLKADSRLMTADELEGGCR